MAALHPKESFDLIGHAEIERQLLDQAVQKRLPNAYLLIGAPGIGKATIAWRLARFLLSGTAEPPADDGGLFGNTLPAASPESLFVSKEHPAVSRMLAGSHADFLLIEREWDDKKKAFKVEIAVDSVRRIGNFLSHTAGEGRWKVVLVDPVDALNISAANAMLKWLEEPPANSLFLLVSNNPGKILPTIRSRCRMLALKAPDEDGFGDILGRSGLHLDGTERSLLHRLSGGSPGIALQLKQDRADIVYAELLKAVEAAESPALNKLADKLTFGREIAQWDTIGRLVSRFVSQAAKFASGAEPHFLSLEEADAVRTAVTRKPLDYWLELWEKCSALLRDTENLHLNRKHALFTVLLALSGVAAVSDAMG